MKMFLNFAISIVAVSFGSAVLATGSSSEILDRELTSRKELKSIEGKGVLQCAEGTHAKSGNCDLRFTRLSDKKKFKIVANPALVAAHCDDHQDIEVWVSGRVVATNAFGLDQLKVSAFRVKSKLNADEVWELTGSVVSKERGLISKTLENRNQ
jgi:hypothetical protein